MSVDKSLTPGFRTGKVKSSVQSLHPSLWKGLVAAFSPEVGISNTIYDISPYKHTGTFAAGTPKFTPNGRNGLAYFSSSWSSDYISIPDSQALQIAGAFSVAVWFNSSSTNNYSGEGQHIINKMVSSGVTTSTFQFIWNADRMRIQGTSGTVFQSSPRDMVANRWYFAVATFDGTTCTWYVDGKHQGSGTGVTFNNTTNPIVVGVRQDGSFPFLGRVGPLFIYNRALTQGEVKGLMINTNQMFVPKKSSVSHIPPTTVQQTVNSDATIIATIGQTINSDAKIKVSDIQQTVTSDAYVINSIRADINSDAVIYSQKQETTSSDAVIINYGLSGTIPSDAYMFIRGSYPLNSDATIKAYGVQATVLSDANVAHIGTVLSDATISIRYQPTITSDAEIHNFGRVLSDASIIAQTQQIVFSDAQIAYRSELLSDARIVFRQNIPSDAELVHQHYLPSDAKVTFYYKDFYATGSIQTAGLKDFYCDTPSVVNNTPTIPTGLSATDIKKGDAVQLNWTADSNYSYNVYQTSPGPRTLMNGYVIPGGNTSYIVGGLTAGTTYTFVLVGVNGFGVESSDSSSANATPTFPDYTAGADRIKQFTYDVKINGIRFNDAMLTTVELGYGTAPAVARFVLPRDPYPAVSVGYSGYSGQSDYSGFAWSGVSGTSGFSGFSGLPTDGMSVEVVVNSRSIFKGKIKNIERQIGSNGKAVSYIAYSDIIKYMERSLTLGEVQSYKNSYNIDCSDQTPLQAFETIANYLGNYRVYYDMNTGEISRYALGTGFQTRKVELGKNVIEWAVTEDTVNVVKKVTVIGGVAKYRTSWTTPAWRPLGYGEQQDILYETIIGWNISDVRVEACQSISAPQIFYKEELSVVPSDFENRTEWPPSTVYFDAYGGTGEQTVEGSVEPRKPVDGEVKAPPVEWQGAGTQIEYDTVNYGGQKVPVKATVILSSKPKVLTPDIQFLGTATRKGRVTGEDYRLEDVSVANPTIERKANTRMSWTYEDRFPSAISAGTGTPSRTVTDSSYQPYIDGITGERINPFPQMSQRAYGELAKVNRPVIGGRIQILGDETMQLKTLLDCQGVLLDIIRVTHNFTNGFTTDIELTNEKFRINIPPYSAQRKQVDYERKTTGFQAYLGNVTNTIEKRPGTQFTQLDPPKPDKNNPFAVYAD